MKTIKTIDYTPLEENWNALFGATLPKAITTIFLISIFAIVVLISFGMVWPSVISTILFMPLMSYLVGRYIKSKNDALHTFAKKNGWTVTPKHEVTLDMIPPGLTSVGHLDRMQVAIRAVFGNHLCDLVMFDFTSTNRDSSNTPNDIITVARVILPRQFPHIILDGKYVHVSLSRGNATTRVKLHRNFEKKYSMYYNENEHIDALSVITPDVMEALVSIGGDLEIEIFGNNLYFIGTSSRLDPFVMEKLLQAVHQLADEIAHKAKTIKYHNTVQLETLHQKQETFVTKHIKDERSKHMRWLLKVLGLVIVVPIVVLIAVLIIISFISALFPRY